jgi:hypothetical protein
LHPLNNIIKITHSQQQWRIIRQFETLNIVEIKNRHNRVAPHNLQEIKNTDAKKNCSQTLFLSGANIEIGAKNHVK